MLFLLTLQDSPSIVLGPSILIFSYLALRLGVIAYVRWCVDAKDYSVWITHLAFHP